MGHVLPPFVAAERDSIVAEVYGAFKEVSRDGGVSWSEAYEIDCWHPPEGEQAKRQAEAKASDLDVSWRELIDDPKWSGAVGLGGWNFLDAIGFRYYLPAQMVRCLRIGGDCAAESLAFKLTLGEQQRDHILQGWELLDRRQRRCVKRFLQYMDVVEPGDWDNALESYWQNIPDGPESMTCEDYVRSTIQELETLAHDLKDDVDHMFQTLAHQGMLLTYARTRIEQSIETLKKSAPQHFSFDV